MEESIFGEFLFFSGALLIAFSLMMKEMKQFRYLYIVASMIYIVYGIYLDHLSVVFASALFLGINIYFLSKFSLPFGEVLLPGRFLEIYDTYKAYITTTEFNHLIDRSKPKTFLKENLIEKGQEVHELMLIVNGTVDIISDGKVINSIGPGNFIGEFGILTGNSASATVYSKSIVEVITWTKYVFETEKSLRQLVSINLVNKLIHINKHQAIESVPTKSV